MPTVLPTLTDKPTRHPGCCLSLSKPLISTIHTLLISAIPPTPFPTPPLPLSPDPEPSLILSIGSGTGLLEELLHTYLTKAHETNTAAKAEADRRCSWRVEGVEVNSNVNIYLPEDRISHVSGTWAVLERVRIRDAAALLFVYPRDGALVRRYFEEFMTTSPENSAAESEEQDGVGSEMASGSGIEEWSEQARKKEDREGDDNSECRHAPPRRRGVQLIIWLGPKADWEDTGFGAFDAGDEFEILKMREDVGLAEFEMLATLGRKS